MSAAQPPQQPAAQWYFAPKGPGKGRFAAVVLLSVFGVALSVGLWWVFLGPGVYDAPTPIPSPTPEVVETSAAPTPEPTSPSPIVIPTPVFSTTPDEAQELITEPERPTLEDFTTWATSYFYEAEAAISWIGDGSKEDASATASNLVEYAETLAHARAPEAIHTQWEQHSAAFLSASQAIARTIERGGSTTETTATAQASLAQLEAVLTASPSTAPTPSPTPVE